MTQALTNDHAIACEECRATGPIAEGSALLVHRRGCGFGALLQEAESLGKAVMMASPDFGSVRIYSTFDLQ